MAGTGCGGDESIFTEAMPPVNADTSNKGIIIGLKPVFWVKL
jgi:hypothetical protein